MAFFLKTLRFGLSLAAVCFIGFYAPPARAQGNPGSGGPQPGQPTAVPIDGGASLLLAAGATYGLKKLRDARRR
ncbi:PID-CTERM protein-sorting domain-containing protein [Hymenobacter sp. B81]|uniref:PID-CTERM protein-sorting domain-containing protein n=1 Tax=Hymenobacter sp. B81 TaxID=3344878 RepID=UPI0037DCE9B7